MTMVAEAMFGCSGSVADLPCAPVLLEETLDYACNAAEQQILPPSQISARHSNDPPPPWCTPKELSDHCRHIVADFRLGETPPTSSSFFLHNPFVGNHHLKVLSLWKSLKASAQVLSRPLLVFLHLAQSLSHSSKCPTCVVSFQNRGPSIPYLVTKPSYTCIQDPSPLVGNPSLKWTSIHGSPFPTWS
jgi:hypothetical protein